MVTQVCHVDDDLGFKGAQTTMVVSAQVCHVADQFMHFDGTNNGADFAYLPSICNEFGVKVKKCM